MSKTKAKPISKPTTPTSNAKRSPSTTPAKRTKRDPFDAGIVDGSRGFTWRASYRGED